MKKTNLFKTLTAITTAAVMSALTVSTAFAAADSKNGIHTAGKDTFSSTGDSPTFSTTGGATSTGDVYINVYGAYPTQASEGTYKVEVEWTSLEFTYNNGTWDTGSHSYTGSTGWQDNKSSGTIKVTNHSNWSIKHSAAFTDGTTATKNNVTATITPPTTNADTLSACPISSGGTTSTAPSVTYTVNVALDDDSKGVTAKEGFILDTVTVTITPDEPGASNIPANSSST